MAIDLKIKTKLLAQEGRIIKKEEAKLIRLARKMNKSRQWALNKHQSLYQRRKGSVSYEARHTHLAHNFLNGMPYRAVELAPKSSPNWDKVEAMVLRYGDGDSRSIKQRFEEWKQENPS